MQFLFDLARYNPWGFATMAGFFAFALGAWVLDVIESRRQR